MNRYVNELQLPFETSMLIDPLVVNKSLENPSKASATFNTSDPLSVLNPKFYKWLETRGVTPLFTTVWNWIDKIEDYAHVDVRDISRYRPSTALLWVIHHNNTELRWYDLPEYDMVPLNEAKVTDIDGNSYSHLPDKVYVRGLEADHVYRGHGPALINIGIPHLATGPNRVVVSLQFEEDFTYEEFCSRLI